MAPITIKNLNTAQQLLNYCEVKHVSEGYLETVIVDGDHLFQFKHLITEQIDDLAKSKFKNSFYTNDIDQVRRIENKLLRIWKSARIPFAMTLDKADSQLINPKRLSSITSEEYVSKLDGATPLKVKNSFDEFTEKDVLDTIINAQKGILKPFFGDSIRQYGTYGRAFIHPPDIRGLPEIVFNIYHFDKHSTFGAEDSIIISVLRNKTKGKLYVPTAFIGDNSRALDFTKKLFNNIIPKNNFQLAKKDELQIRIHGNNLFCGWTIPIRLSEKVMIPAASLLLEGYGNIQTRTFSVRWPSGYRMDLVGNYLESFVTFFHPASKYSGPGTDSTIGREIIMELYQQ